MARTFRRETFENGVLVNIETRPFTAGEMAAVKKSELQNSDEGFVRVLDDLIDALIQKNVLTLGDLPQDARTRFARRKALRAE